MFFSEECLFLNATCNLKCLSCQSWPFDKKQAFKSLIDTGRFYTKFKTAATYNILGGNPLLHDELYELLQFLKSEHKYIRLWINPMFQIDELLLYKEFVDECLIFFPAAETPSYQAFNGVQDLSACVSNLSDLRSEGLDFRLHTFVNDLLISELPDHVEFCLSHRFPLLLHYQTNSFTADEKKSIHYFSTHASVRVVGVGFYPDKYSCIVPVYDPSFAYRYQYSILKSKMRRIADSFRV